MSVAVAEKPIALPDLKTRVAEKNYSCTSMVVTVFGDTVSQHGGWVWLGSLIKVLGLMGYSERLVRTAVYRLVQQDWLQAEKIGRRSYYRFTSMADAQYEKAARRIYAPTQPQWDGTWTLVSPVMVPDEKRDLLRKSLLWQGYNTLLTGLFAHPSGDRTSLNETLKEQQLADKVLVFSAVTNDRLSADLLSELAQHKWNLEELQGMYREFLAFYRVIDAALNADRIDSQSAFVLRTLLIHEYRRILLRDPDFPAAVLPADWLGLEAQALTRQLYRKLLTSSLRYVQANLKNADGALPEALATFQQRFVA